MTNMIKATEQEKKNEAKSTATGSTSKLEQWLIEHGFGIEYNTKKGCCIVMSKKPKKVNR